MSRIVFNVPWQAARQSSTSTLTNTCALLGISLAFIGHAPPTLNHFSGS